MKTGVFFGSTTGNTQSVAEDIAKHFNADVYNIGSVQPEIFQQYDFLIFGASTWGFGDLQDDWEEFLQKNKSFDLEGKTVSLFGLGDAASYPDTFVDGIGTIYEAIKNSGCKVIGGVSGSGYDFSGSTAFLDDSFIGLPVDEDGEHNLTQQRIENWVALLKTELE